MKRKRYIISIILVLGMMILAQYTGEREIIFPEILALTVGAWIADKQPWIVTRIELVMLMTIGSIVGICIVKFVNVDLVLQVAIALIFTAIALKITKTTLVPMISACVLPVLLQTDMWIYPIAVFVMSIIIVLVQYLMDKFDIRSHVVKTKEYKGNSSLEKRKENVRLIKLFVIIMAVTIISVKSGNTFFMAPPLIVAFVELSEVESKVRENPKKLFGLFAIAIIIGTTSRIILNMTLSLPLWIAALVATVGIFICFEKFELLFPPVAAMALLPMLLETEQVKGFLLQAIVGSLVFIIIAIYLFRDDNIKNENGNI